MEEDFKIRIGRPRKDVDLKKVMQLHRDGKTLMYIAEQFGISYGTIWNRIREAKKQRGKEDA